MARIFVSYRREDSPGHTGRLYDHLVAHFGEKLVFRDIEAIEPGVDFVHAIEEAVDSCGVLLAVIGPQWLNARDKQGRRRLDNPRDFVRLEVAAALSRNVRVIPVLVGGATFPSEEELPPDLAPLARRNAIEISDPRFRTDMAHLIRIIQVALGRTHPPEKPTQASGEPRPGVQWRRWGAVGFVIALTVVVLAGILWVQGRAPKPTEMEGIGGSGDAGVAEGPALNPPGMEQEGIGGAGDAGVIRKPPRRFPPSGAPRNRERTPRQLPGDAGVVQPPLDAGADAGTDAGVVQPPLDAGTDAGTDAGVVQPPLDAGTDAGIATPPPPWDAGTMDEDGGTGGSPPQPETEPESPSEPEPEPESPSEPEPESWPDSGSEIPPETQGEPFTLALPITP